MEVQKQHSSSSSGGGPHVIIEESKLGDDVRQKDGNDSQGGDSQPDEWCQESFEKKLSRHMGMSKVLDIPLYDDFLNVFTEEDLLGIEVKEAVFNLVAADFSCDLGKSESHRERRERDLKDINLTYGELEFKSFCQVFTWIQKSYKDKDPECWHNAFNVPGGSFIDLGHGTGKGILTGAFLHQFELAWGIECLKSLQNVSLNLKEVYHNYLRDVAEEDYSIMFGWPVSSAARFEPFLGDIFGMDWHDVDMIFCNSTCFTDEMMESIYQQSLQCKKGTWIVTTSKQLPKAERVPPNCQPRPDLKWELTLAINLQMSWGIATVNAHRKLSHPEDL